MKTDVLTVSHGCWVKAPGLGPRPAMKFSVLPVLRAKASSRERSRRKAFSHSSSAIKHPCGFWQVNLVIELSLANTGIYNEDSIKSHHLIKNFNMGQNDVLSTKDPMSKNLLSWAFLELLFQWGPRQTQNGLCSENWMQQRDSKWLAESRDSKALILFSFHNLNWEVLFFLRCSRRVLRTGPVTTTSTHGVAGSRTSPNRCTLRPLPGCYTNSPGKDAWGELVIPSMSG